MSEPDEPISPATDWHRRMLRRDMTHLPPWVKEQYLEYLGRLIDRGPWDDATIDFNDRIDFYERILTDPNCTKIWKTLEAHRPAALEGLQVTNVNQVEDLLTTAHSTFIWYSPNEALKKKDRDKLGGAISATSRKLANLLNTLWLGSPESERSYPLSFGAIDHGEVMELLTAVQSSSEKWITSDRFVHKPGAGDGHRRYFMCSMANWFETVYRESDPDTGEVRAYRFDNVVTALTNCLFVEVGGGGMDQSTVTKVLDAAEAARA
jgi:hypothetical protein